MIDKRFEMVTVEDPLWEYGTHLKEVLQDNLTGKQYRAVNRLVDLLNKLYEENERLKNKLNVTALELVDEAISMGKAVEISEMDYHEFLEHRQKKGKPMELQR